MKSSRNNDNNEKDQGPELLKKLLKDNAIIGAIMGVARPKPQPQGEKQHEQVTPPKPSKEEILDEIACSTDMEALLNGISADLALIVSPEDDLEEEKEGLKESVKENAVQENAMTQEATRTTHKDEKEQENGGPEETEKAQVYAHTPTPPTTQTNETTPFYETTLAARLYRIKSLLYNERTMASATSQQNSNSKRFQQAPKRKLFPQISSSSPPQHPQSQSSQQPSDVKLITVASAVLHSILESKERKQLIPTLLCHLHKLPFEARKDVASIFNHLLVCGCVHSGGGGGGKSASNNTNSGGTEFWGSLRDMTREGGGDATTEETVASYVQTMFGFVSYIEEHYASIISPIVVGHYMGPADGRPMMKTPDVALHCGSMLRSTLRHPSLYALLLSSDYAPRFVYPFLDYMINQPNFEVASDALETFRLMMSGGGVPVVPMQVSHLPTATDPKELEAYMESIGGEFLEREYQAIFMERFNRKLLNVQTANYITRRVSLQLLSTILLTRSNYNVMIQYVSNRSNLMAIMILLRDASAHITLDAFHVFKIFVANPNKPPEIVRILSENKVKLVKYLSGLHKEKEENDEQFRDEKALVLATLETL